MTGFANVLGGIKHWLEHIYHTATAKEIISIGSDVGKQIIVNAAIAGMAAHASGADKDATIKAIENAATHTAATVGVSASTEEIGKIVGHISDSIHGDAPQPPVSQ